MEHGSRISRRRRDGPANVAQAARRGPQPDDLRHQRNGDAATAGEASATRSLAARPGGPLRDRVRFAADACRVPRGGIRRRWPDPRRRNEAAVNTCTVGVPFVREIEQAMAARGVTVIDCPISGGPPGARAGTLSVMVSGDPAAIERVRPMISLWGRTLTVAGDQPGAAQVLKLTNNILSAVALVATAEAFVMGSKAGLDPEVMLAAINAGSGRNSATLDKFPAAVLTRSFDYGAEMQILMKDVDLAVAQGEELGVPMWVCQAARLVFKHAIHKGAAADDITAIAKYIERDSGFEIPKTR